jgi:hypothetical protein
LAFRLTAGWPAMARGTVSRAASTSIKWSIPAVP